MADYADVRALAAEMADQKQLASLPSAADPAFAPDDSDRWNAFEDLVVGDTTGPLGGGAAHISYGSPTGLPAAVSRTIAWSGPLGAVPAYGIAFPR